MAENLAQYLGAVSPIPGAAGGRSTAHDDCGGSELSFRPDAHGADASSRQPLGGRAEVSFTAAGDDDDEWRRNASAVAV